MSERIINQFKKLQETGPSSEWIKNTRDFLVTRVEQDTIAQKTSIFSQFKLFFNESFNRLMPSPLKAISVLIIICLIGGTGLFAQAESNPKAPLYFVKKTWEKIELVFAVTAKSETKVHLKHAAKRQEEAVKLAKKQNLSSEEKEGLINTVISALEQDINAAGNSLEIVNESSQGTNKAAQLAQKITSNIKENLQVLDDVKEIADLEGVAQSVSNVQSAIQEVESASIELLILQAESEEAILQIKEILNGKIERTNKNISEVSQMIGGVDLNKIIILKEVESGTTKIQTRLNIKEVVNEATKVLTAAQNFLNEAKLLLEERSLLASLEKITESSEKVKETKKVLARVIDGEESVETQETYENIGNTQEDLQIKGVIEGIILNDNATTTSETTPEIIEDILNYAPLGGEVNQAAQEEEQNIPEDD